MTVVSESATYGERAAVEIKAATFTLPVVRLLHTDLGLIAAQAEDKIHHATEFFRHAPVIIDLSALSAEHDPARLDMAQLVRLLRRLELVPVGLRGGSVAQQETAKTLGLAALGEQTTRAPRVATAAKPAAERHADDPRSDGEGGSLLIVRPVRSGQKIYAAGGDLTVLAPVNSGAELMADGSIHVYAPLRGRVFAGIRGQRQARIFCQDLQAELVAVAGHYRVSENIPAALKGTRVQIYLEREALRIEPL